MFVSAHPKADQELADTNLISYTLIKLYNTGGMYTKALNRWNTNELTNRKMWDTFCQHMISEIENIIASGAGPTLGQ